MIQPAAVVRFPDGSPYFPPPEPDPEAREKALRGLSSLERASRRLRAYTRLLLSRVGDRFVHLQANSLETDRLGVARLTHEALILEYTSWFLMIDLRMSKPIDFQVEVADGQAIFLLSTGDVLGRPIKHLRLVNLKRRPHA